MLLSYDQHANNLDNTCRKFLSQVPHAFTATVGAARLGRHADGLVPWPSVSLRRPDGTSVTITAPPARLDLAGIESAAGEVNGFVLQLSGGAAPI